MVRLLLLLISLVVARCSSFSSEVVRKLEDGSGGNFAYYTMKAGSCIRMKVADDNDDDGNAYFYNGAYRSQFDRYASFFLCSQVNGKEECDYSQEYLTDLESYLETMSEYVQYYCYACSNECRRRRLEDEHEEEEEEEEEEQNWQVNCNTCSSECSLMQNYDGNDETAYVGCQWAYQDGDIDYYAGPSCDNGKFAIGYYYDEDCSIKSKNDDEFSYNTFQTIQQMSVDCSSGPCEDLYDEAIYCEDGYNEDYSKLCKAAAEARKERSYYQEPWYKKMEIPGILFFVVLIGGSLTFLSYTYYVRHSRPKAPMATLDGTNLPEIA